jgi:hypothetical protein
MRYFLTNYINTMATKKPAAKKTAAKKTAAKKTATKGEGIVAYSVSLKKKVTVTDAKIEKTARGGYMLRAIDPEGNKVTQICSQANALDWIEKGLAEQDF